MSELGLEVCVGFNHQWTKGVPGRGKGRAACKKKAIRKGCTKAVQGPGGGWPSVTGGSSVWVMGEEVGKAGRGQIGFGCQAMELGSSLWAVEAMGDL